ncbi:hypothetical protein [Hymenobacter sp. GOD-10R]|uniref:hypothetical protein n=1 Tax=Hymenobacter sp. GOD-10R TaxID=3093922 RepID=UPI002D792358|nr:hypothetical protein [Hymenobacter sp. GOD-10R]WRQ30840.1 hypothetical protein SD425_11255 [Hymenobacter sp. GOD-10R]
MPTIFFPTAPLVPYEAYERVRTQPQGRSSFGLAAQQPVARSFVPEEAVLGELGEVECGKTAE